METPWGPLSSLDLADHDVCRQILASDKHQLIEGLVVESLFDQIFDGVPAHLKGSTLLDVDTAIVDARKETGQWQAFVWARELQPGLGRYLMALERRFRVWLVQTDKPLTTFMARECKGGKALAPTQPLADVMAGLTGRKGRVVPVAAAVRDTARQQQSFWGFLSSQHGDALGNRIILPRLFMNCGIQPWFRAVWNLDRVLVHGEQVWLLEIKHKYPMGRQRLAFGLNAGELGVIVQLGEAGVRCLHTIIVKPRWTKDSGSMYLMNDMRLRSRAAMIAVDLDAATTAAMIAGGRRSSASHTTFTGSGQLNFHSIEARQFKQLGLLSDPPDQLAGNLAAAIAGSHLPPVADAWLMALKERTG